MTTLNIFIIKKQNRPLPEKKRTNKPEKTIIQKQTNKGNQNLLDFEQAFDYICWVDLWRKLQKNNILYMVNVSMFVTV